MKQDLIHRLLKRAEIRRSIQHRKSVQEGKPDRLADLLDEAAEALIELKHLEKYVPFWCPRCGEFLTDESDIAGECINCGYEFF